jgi:hypothetical protein
MLQQTVDLESQPDLSEKKKGDKLQKIKELFLTSLFV